MYKKNSWSFFKHTLSLDCFLNRAFLLDRFLIAGTAKGIDSDSKLHFASFVWKPEHFRYHGSVNGEIASVQAVLKNNGISAAGTISLPLSSSEQWESHSFIFWGEDTLQFPYLCSILHSHAPPVEILLGPWVTGRRRFLMDLDWFFMKTSLRSFDFIKGKWFSISEEEWKTVRNAEIPL